MAWSTPLTAVSNATLTAAQWNASLRDNMLVTPAALATTAGRIFVATGANAIAERVVGRGIVNTSETTASTTWADLATPGPAVTLTTGTAVIVVMSAFLANSSAGANSQMGYAVSGATTAAADSHRAVIYESGAANDLAQMSYMTAATGLTAGSNTFTAQYQVSAGTGTFHRRQLFVFPFS
jgi:hypothetical protein